MRMNPHLSFDGQCEAAFKFYEDCLGGRITFMLTYDASPGSEPLPPGWGKKICHASFSLGDQHFSGADIAAEGYRKPQGFWITLHAPSPEEAERIFAKLAENGEVEFPLQETFWAHRFGMVVDRFGIPWSINCGKSA